MHSIKWFSLGSVVAGAAGVLALSASGAGCSSSDTDTPVAADSGAEAAVDATIVILPEASTPQGPCMTCFEMTNAEARIPDSPGPCAENLVGDTGKSSKQLFDEAFKCACDDLCPSECADSCGSGASISPACTVCASDKCSKEYVACYGDVRKSDAGTGGTDDASTDGAVNDAGINDAGAGGQ